jgi:SET domain-containing protein
VPHRCARVLARYINDGGDASAQNARFVKIPSRRRACVLAMRDIRKGDEIYASYGPLYWTNQTDRYAAPSYRNAQQTPYLTSSVVSTRPPVSNIVGN